jgi:membrane peptidoglycan carboxypeptidase
MTWKPANDSTRTPTWIPGWIPSWLCGLFRWLFKWGLVSLAVLVAVGLFYFYLSLKYDLTEVSKIPERSVILDRLGEEFATIHGERRRLITREEIPEVMVLALRAREDLAFPDHVGVDIKGLARATLRNIRDMSYTQGASTLTMQLTRNSYDLRAKSLHRKLLEIAITLRIEGRYEKDEILTHYLNRIYFGAGCHGVEEASQTYFGRSTVELNTGECALLVGIIRGPHLFSPFRNRKGAMVQRDEVLSRMVQCDFLSEKDRESAQNDPIRLVALKDRHRGSSYVRESIRRQLQVILDRHGIRDGGLTIHTTLDAGLQSRCDQVLGAPLRGLERGNAGKLPRLQGAVVSIDAQTGGILSLCGGRNFRESSYNRAYLARRDLGPAFIPFLNAIALERGKVTIPGQPVQTGRQLGVDETMRLSKRLGFTGPFADTEDLYRGTIAASPVELAIATAVLTAEGNKIEPYIIARITDAAGRILYQRDPSNSQVIMKDSAIEALAGMDLKNNGSWIATTRSRHDAWALHIRESRVMAFWIGYDQPRVIAPRPDIKRAMQAMITRVQP